MMDHVTSCCSFYEPATIRTMNGIVAKLYGPWLQADVVCYSNGHPSQIRTETYENSIWEQMYLIRLTHSKL